MMERIIDHDQQSEVVAVLLKEVIDSRIVLAYLKNRRLTKSARTFVGAMDKTLNLCPRNARRHPK
jgi:hypothetical protein